jgi:hypothetical protein
MLELFGTYDSFKGHWLTDGFFRRARCPALRQAGCLPLQGQCADAPVTTRHRTAPLLSGIYFFIVPAFEFV